MHTALLNLCTTFMVMRPDSQDQQSPSTTQHKRSNMAIHSLEALGHLLNPSSHTFRHAKQDSLVLVSEYVTHLLSCSGATNLRIHDDTATCLEVLRQPRLPLVLCGGDYSFHLILVALRTATLKILYLLPDTGALLLGYLHSLGSLNFQFMHFPLKGTGILVFHPVVAR